MAPRPSPARRYLAGRAGIRLFATGGLGGVHREARETWDESADLMTLSRTPIAVVCAGVKSILDVGATLERLESLNVTVIGYGTRRFPGFYLADSGFALDWSVDSPEAAGGRGPRADRYRPGCRPASSSPTPIPVGEAARSRAARAGADGRAGRSAAAGHARQGRHAVPARLFPGPRPAARACA